MRDRISRGIEIAANVSIIIAAGIGAFTLLERNIATNVKRQESPVSSVKNDSRGENLVGRRVSLSDVDWAKNGHTLLVILATRCHFCTESAEFYKQIASLAAEQNNFQVVAVFPQDVNDAKGYLDELQIPISEVRQVPLNEIGVRGTPTLLLVNRAGVVKDAWLGRLKSDKEAEVLKEAACRECS